MSEENSDGSSKIKSDDESAGDVSPITTNEPECVATRASDSVKTPNRTELSISNGESKIISMISMSGGSEDVPWSKTESESCQMQSESTTSSTNSSSGSEYDETTTSSEELSHQEIEESILQMIKHIDTEIESEDHAGLHENRFQNIEMKIKTSRVMVAIEQTIQKLEIAFSLPYIFVENMHDMSKMCGETNMNKLMHEYCKIRDADDMDICRFQPAVINCINEAYEAGFSNFLALHRKKV